MNTPSEGSSLCPHGMPLAGNVCGPCSRGSLNQPTEPGFGIAILAKMVRERVQLGHSQEAAFNYIVGYAELRSEAIDQLRAAVNGTGSRA